MADFHVIKNVITGEVAQFALTAEEQTERANAAALAEQKTALAALVSIDLASIRSIREYIAAKPDAPQILKDHEAAAIVERAKLGGGG